MPRTNTPQIVPAQLRNQQIIDHAGQRVRVAIHGSLRKQIPVLCRDIGTAWLTQMEGTDWFKDLIATTTFIVSIHSRKNTTNWSLLTSASEWDLLWLYRGEQVIPVTLITYTTLSRDEERDLIAAWLLRHPLFYGCATRAFIDFGRRNRFFDLSKRDFGKLAGLKETTLHHYLKQLRDGGSTDPTANTERQRMTKQPAEKASVPADALPAQIPGDGVAADAENPTILPPHPLEMGTSQPGNTTTAELDNPTSEGLTAAGLITEQGEVHDTDNGTTPTRGAEALPLQQPQDETPNPTPAVATTSQLAQETEDHALDLSQPSDDPSQPVQPSCSIANQVSDDSPRGQLPLFALEAA